MTIALHGRRLRQRLLLGTLAGLTLYAQTLWWLTGFAVPGYVGVMVRETALLAVAVALRPAARTGRWSGGWWTVPVAFILLDTAQTRFPFDGFPLPALVLG